MPINTCLDHITKCAAVWNYIPYEEIDFTKYYFIKLLRIECFNPAEAIEDNAYHPPRKIHPSSEMSRYYYNWSNTETMPLETGPYTLPSIKHLFPRLETLIISNGNRSFKKESPVYIERLTDIPSTIKNLDIEYTMIGNIGDILHTCDNMVTLKLHRNIYQIDMKEDEDWSLPPNLIRLNIYLETFTNAIYVPDSLYHINIVTSTIPGIRNLQYKPNKDIIMYGCDTPYDNNILINQTQIHKKFNHINMVNAHSIYMHFGSIPKRIRVSNDDDLENPIIVAFHLSSNYPRRIAEFMSYVS